MYVDIQIISATNKTLNEIEETEVLRNDLFHRLNTVLISLPPLREREKDINLLLKFYIDKFTKQFAAEKHPLPKELLKKLKTAHWKGNIRQFTNFVKNWILFGEISENAEIESWFSNRYNESGSNEFIFKFNEGNMSEIEDAKVWLTYRKEP